MIKLFVSTFGESVEWIKFKQVIPIEVGVKCRSESMVRYDLTDGLEDSISDLNPFFGELTGLYWIWKNYNFCENEIVGFAHYNKILDITPKMVEQLVKDKKIEWIVRDPVKMVKHDYQQDIEVLENILKKYYTSYYSVWKELYNSNGESKTENCVNCEMFYTSVEEFNNYCKFLFGVLFKVFEVIGDVDREPYHKRYCAFLGERLLSVYLIKNNKTQYNVLIRDKSNIFVDFLRKVSRILKLDRNSTAVRVVRNLVKSKNRKSSYISNVTSKDNQ